MTDTKRRPGREPDTVAMITAAMTAMDMANDDLAVRLGMRPEVTAVIVSGELPVPLIWVPRIADALDIDAGPLMTRALGEQWLPILTATATSLLWEEGQIHREMIDFLTTANGGECPSVGEDPGLAERLEAAIRGDGEADDDEGMEPSRH